jgi:hypothetical protein
MNFSTYFRFALFLPFVIGALTSILPVPPVLNAISFSVAIVAVPYSIFTVAVMIWSRGRPDRLLIKASWLLPIIFTPIVFVCAFLIDGLSSQPGQLISFFGFLSVATLAIGYLFVILGWLGYVALLWLKRVLGHGA